MAQTASHYGYDPDPQMTPKWTHSDPNMIRTCESYVVHGSRRLTGRQEHDRSTAVNHALSVLARSHVLPTSLNCEQKIKLQLLVCPHLHRPPHHCLAQGVISIWLMASLCATDMTPLHGCMDAWGGPFVGAYSMTVFSMARW